jgi:hypothetical protein
MATLTLRNGATLQLDLDEVQELIKLEVADSKPAATIDQATAKRPEAKKPENKAKQFVKPFGLHPIDVVWDELKDTEKSVIATLASAWMQQGKTFSSQELLLFSKSKSTKSVGTRVACMEKYLAVRGWDPSSVIERQRLSNAPWSRYTGNQKALARVFNDLLGTSPEVVVSFLEENMRPREGAAA